MKVPYFGYNESRNHFIDEILPDSLSIKWEREGYGSLNNIGFTIVDDKMIYGDLSGRVYNINIENGKTLNDSKNKGAITTNVLSLKNKLIYILNDHKELYSTIIVHNINTNKVLYEHEITGGINNQPIIYNEEVLIVSDRGEIINLDALGNIKNTIETNSTVSSAPAIWKDNIVFCNDEGNILIYNTDKLEYKSFQIADTVLNSVVVDEDNIITSSYGGEVISCNIEKQELNWKTNVGDRFFSSPTFDDKSVYIGNLNGILYVFEKESGKVSWKYDSKGLINTPVLVFNNKIVLNNLAKEILILDKHTHAISSSIKVSGRPRITPFCYNETLYVGYDKGIIRAYEFVYE